MKQQFSLASAIGVIQNTVAAGADAVESVVARENDSPVISVRHEPSGSVRVVHLQRRAFPGQKSIELLFDNLRQAMRDMGVDAFAATAPYYSKGLIRRLAAIVWAWRNQADVNHVTGDVHFLAIGLRAGRTILTIHDCLALERLSGFKRWLMRVLWFNLPIRRAAFVTVISNETKRQLLSHVRVPPHKVLVIPNAPAPIFRACAKRFNADCPNILHIGTAPNKNLPRLIEAVRGMRCRLTIVGDLDQRSRGLLDKWRIPYQSLCELAVEEMYSAYCEADIVCFVSTYEGFGMPIIEAQWVERPVVTSNCSSMPEVAGDGACLVDPLDVESIRSGLQRVIGDEAYRAKLVEEGRKNRERFSMSAVARQYIALYERVALASHEQQSA